MIEKVVILCTLVQIHYTNGQPESPLPSTCNSCCQGQTGREGNPGIPGVPGVPGIVGPKGDKGESLKGERGDVGFRGERGDAGSSGLKGEKGLGLRGPHGKIGPVGVTGPVGSTGLPGVKGQKGEMGQSLKGVRGDVGSRGEKGDPGSPGLKGEHGLRGLRGPPGPVGTAGPVGSSGLPGVKGQKGEIGQHHVTPVSAFNAVRRSTFIPSSAGIPLPFEQFHTNVGDDFDLASGRFTCEIPGIYLFTYSLLTYNSNPHVRLMKDDTIINSVYHSDTAVRDMLSNAAVLQLGAGEQVWLSCTYSGRQIHSNSNHYTSFSGVLLHQI